MKRGRPTRKKWELEWFHPPAECRPFLERRVAAFVKHYGHCITSMNIETLAVSCYSQGIEDTMVMLDRVKEREPEYSI